MKTKLVPFALGMALATMVSSAAPSLVALPEPSSPARFYVLRLKPGQDLRLELQRFAKREGLRAAFIASCAGSVTCASLRYANQPAPTVVQGHFEITSLSGTLETDAMHVHAEFCDSTGAAFGGHLENGSVVYTTAEVVIGELVGLSFGREMDPASGYRELVVRSRR